MPADRPKDSRLSGSSASHDMPPVPSHILNPWISPEEFEGAKDAANGRRDREDDRRLDNMVEDTFPASDPPSTSPLTANGGPHEAAGTVPPDLKESGAAQFEYGRRTEAKTHHFDTSSRRLERGNPDVGEIDLGTIEADKPAQPDDNDHYDSADDEIPKEPRLRDDVVQKREEF